jgi:DNA-binding transcriptional MerR regulator
MRIGELAKAVGAGVDAIRFYERTSLLPDPGRASSGNRDYPPTAVDRIEFIRAAQAAGFSLAEIREILAIRDAGQVPCTHVADLIDRHLERVEERIAELEHARSVLRTLADRPEEVGEQECGEAAICQLLAKR